MKREWDVGVAMESEERVGKERGEEKERGEKGKHQEHDTSHKYIQNSDQGRKPTT